jgi:translation initiation factor 2 subunit 2
MPDKKHRKSVVFSEGATVMDENGTITETNHPDDKTTAEKHSASK